MKSSTPTMLPSRGFYTQTRSLVGEYFQSLSTPQKKKKSDIAGKLSAILQLANQFDTTMSSLAPCPAANNNTKPTQKNQFTEVSLNEKV